MTAAKVLVSEPTCAVLTTAEPAGSGTSASGTSAMNREAKTMLSMHAVMWQLSCCNCLHGGLKADACRLCTFDYCRYLAGPLSLETQPQLQSVSCYNACEEYVYTTIACWNDMILTQTMPCISPSRTLRFNSSDHKADVEHSAWHRLTHHGQCGVHSHVGTCCLCGQGPPSAIHSSHCYEHDHQNGSCCPHVIGRCKTCMHVQLAAISRSIAL